MRDSRLVGVVCAVGALAACARASAQNSPTTIFDAVSTPATQVRGLAFFILSITGLIFLGMTALYAYALIRYRERPTDDTEPPQVYGSTQIELAWTIIPILLIVVLFLGTARVLFAVQDAPKPASALDMVVIGHQFWWELRYPKYNVVTANELHVPLSDPKNPTPTFLKLTSADVMHSFWVPRLAGKTDLLPNRVNEMWVDPQVPGLFLGQCAQFCGTQHAKMLLRVYVDTPEEFQSWIANQQRPAAGSNMPTPNVAALQQPNPGPESGAPPNTPQTRTAAQAQYGDQAITPENGRRVFEQQACINCHTITGTVANGRYGPDLTHLMSRTTLGAGAALNTPENLKAWIIDPSVFKPGCEMPAMHLTDLQNAQMTAYLLTLK
jgi:cytochrome c oxidase subunit II